MDLSSFEALLKTLKINRYDTDFSDQEKIGRGGFASVYKVRNNFDGHYYAIKKIKLAVKDVQRNFDQDLQRLLAEAKVLASIDHPNILRYYNSWLEGTTKKQKPPQKPNIRTHHKLEQENSEDSPFVLKGLEESDEDCSPILFQSSAKGSKTKERKAPEELKNQKRLQVKAGDFVKKSEIISEDSGELSDCSEEEIEEQTPKAKQQPIVFRVGDEILESVTLYIQTELCSETLEDHINKRNSRLFKLKRENPELYQSEKKIYIKEAINYLKHIVSGISHIHAKQIVHRDIKPGNIFLLGRTAKIGDFGLVKRLNSLYPMESSPLVEQPKEEILVPDSFKLDSGPCMSLPNLDEIPYIHFMKTTSNPVFPEIQQVDCVVEHQTSITRSVGTKTFASPEQLQADKEKFDHRADIFSLGLVFLLILHPMNTSMEQYKTIKECKKGIMPLELQNELPEIAGLMIRMLADNPNDRPSLDEISKKLYCPFNFCSEMTGALSVQRENSENWRKKHFKLVDKKLFLFEKENDKKAEQVYDLSHWKVAMKEMNMLGRNEEERGISSSLNKLNVISLEDPMQLGCAFKAENLSKTLELFQKFRSLGESC